MSGDQGCDVFVGKTGENVPECTGGARALNDEDLKDAYKSQVDPRLDYEQALELALLIAEQVGSDKRSDAK